MYRGYHGVIYNPSYTHSFFAAIYRDPPSHPSALRGSTVQGLRLGESGGPSTCFSKFGAGVGKAQRVSWQTRKCSPPRDFHVWSHPKRKLVFQPPIFRWEQLVSGEVPSSLGISLESPLEQAL